jgi:hypothetical protein
MPDCKIVEKPMVDSHSSANRIVAMLANKFPRADEQRLSWMFPTGLMIFRLQADK